MKYVKTMAAVFMSMFALCAALPAAGAESDTTYAGWAVGENLSGYGVILHTGDGGATWNRQGSPVTVPDASLEAVAALDDKTCWAVGDPSDGYGVILRTEDGGETWARQGSPAMIPDVGLMKISAVDKSTAWVVGDPGIVLFTDDGGTTWQNRATGDVPAVHLQNKGSGLES